ncbi:MAG: TonB family protein [Flavobacteriia bacterium]|nr:TonB family protein [Flavobacteriia bacterium]
MIVVFIIVAAITLVSLYDYFSSRNWQQVTSNERNDTVFEKRNRDYGAFVIRRDYDKRLMLIVGGMATGFGVLFAATRGGEITEKIAAPHMVTVEYDIAIEKDKKEDVIDEPKTDPAPVALAQTTAFPEPIVVDNEVIEPITPPEPGLPVGPEPNPGGDPFGGSLPPNPPGNGGGGGTVEPPAPVDPVFEIPDEPAEFPGGHPAMMNYLGSNIRYPQVEAELGIGGKCFLQFIVSKKGDISDVKVMRGVPDCTDCDKEAVRVVKNMPLWRPGRVKGKAVNSYFNLPVKFEVK